MSKAEKTKKRGRQAAGARSSLFAFSPFDFTIIGIDTPHKSKSEHPRYDDRINLPLNEARIREFRTRGVKVPVLFQRDGDQNIIVDGIQRIRNAREAVKLQRKAGEVELKVRGIPVSGDDGKLFGISRALNAHRTDDGPMQNAKNAQRMVEDFHMSVEDVAQDFGVTEQTVKQWLSYLSLSPKAIKAIESGKIGATAAARMAKLPKAEQDQVIAKLPDGGKKPTVAVVANKVREANGKPAVVSPRVRVNQALAAIDELEVDLVNGGDTAQAAVKQIRAILGKTA